MLTTHVYMSRFSRPFDVAELDVMCRHFARRNSETGITGVLMVIGDHFVQVLEGARDPVLDLVERILVDGRHREFRTLHRGLVHERRFPNWSMRMMNLDQHYTVNELAMSELRRLVKAVINSPVPSRTAMVQLLMAIPRVIALDGNAEAVVRSAAVIDVVTTAP